MRKKIMMVSLVRIPKIMFGDMVNNLIATVENHNPAELHIDGVLKLLTDEKSELKKIQNYYPKKPKTEELLAVCKKRRTIIVAILGHIRLIEKIDLPTQKADLDLIRPIVEKNLLKVNTLSEKKRTGSVHCLQEDLKNQTALWQAIGKLNLKTLFDELYATQTIIDSMELERRAETKKMPKMDTKRIVTSISEKVNDLFNSIEISSKEYKELNYTPLIDEINLLLKPYQTQIKSNKTRNKNASIATNTTKKTAPVKEADSVAV